MITQFLLALSFLTRLPVPKSMDLGRMTLSRAAWAFPLVGIIIGLLSGGIYLLALECEAKRIVSAWLAVCFGLLLTGGLHEDGLADTADGLAHGRNREQKLAIMRDSRIGTYGVIALIASLSLRANAIASFSTALETLVAFAAASALSRAAMVFLMYAVSAARTDGLAAMAGKPSTNATLAALWLCLIPLILFIKLTLLLLSLMTVVIACLVSKRVAIKHFGGITGDVLGATQQITEVALLIILSSHLPL